MKYTIWFIALTVAAIALYDVWVIITYGNVESVSRHLLYMGHYVPQVPAMLGYTFGHVSSLLELPLEFRKKVMPYSISGFIIVACTACYDVYQLYWGAGQEGTLSGGKEFNMAVVFGVFFVMGMIFWNMPKSIWKRKVQ